jgi:hypothetical protein
VNVPLGSALLINGGAKFNSKGQRQYRPARSPYTPCALRFVVLNDIYARVKVKVSRTWFPIPALQIHRDLWTDC